MILVVALLALLALLGIAWLSTARSQRAMSQQGVYSAGADQVLNGAVDVTVGAIADAIRGHDTGTTNTSTYRRASYGGQTSSYLNADFHGTYWDDPTSNHEIAAGNQYIASRVPLVSGSGSSATIYWPAISAPLASPKANNPTVDQAQRCFESPWGGGTYNTRISQPDNAGSFIQPTFVQINEGSGSGPLRSYPALRVGNTTYLAADTTGSGIADAGLSRLMQIGDITYYVAYRALDNNSAINVSTAWKPFEIDPTNPGNPTATSVDASYSPIGNFFPSNINLFALLMEKPAGSNKFRTVDQQMNVFNSLRLSNFVTLPLTTMVDDNNGNAGTFYSPYEAFWMQLGRRVDYPGRITGTTFYSAVSAGETARVTSGSVLAPYGDMIMLEAGNTTAKVDSALFETLCIGPTAPYNWPRYSTASGMPDDTYVNRWFYQNFDYSQSGVGYSALDQTTLKWTDFFGFSRRPLLVARNGVSQGVPSVPESGSYPLAPKDPNKPNNCPTPGDMPTKASLNTADFYELWRAYFMVMAGDPSATVDTTPFASIATAADNTLYRGQKFQANGKPDLTEQSLYRMFRNSARTNQVAGGAGLLTPAAMVQLRSALAAINTISLRDGSPSAYTNNDTISVNLTSGQTVQLYGIKPQVFITEVYAENDWVSDPQSKGANPNGYVAIELQNPCTREVDVSGWKIAALDRSTMTFAPIYTFGNMLVTRRPASGDALHADQNLIVIENYNQAGTPTSKGAKYRPQVVGQDPLPLLTGQALPIYVDNLSDVLGKELVILRPPPGGSGADLSAWIPVDSFDFTTFKTRAKLEQEALPVGSGNWTEIFAIPADTTKQLLRSQVTLWHYARNCRNTEPFKCVYPGRYCVTSTAVNSNSPAQQGTRTFTWNTITYAPPQAPAPTDPTTLTYQPATPGSRNADPLDSSLDQTVNDRSTVHPTAPSVDTSLGFQSVSTYRDSEFTIQWGGQDVPGPGGKDATWYSYQSKHPYGGFARNLDALHVPFIGAYVIKGAGGIVAVNAVTMDAVAAEDTDPQDDPSQIQTLTVSGSNFKIGENIGRFVPVRAVVANDFDANTPLGWRYRWAMKMPDYLTVQAPWGDHLPDAPYEYNTSAAATPNTIAGRAAANTDAERSVPVQGLVNINTAPVAVLAAVPFLNWLRDTSISPPYQQWLKDSEPDERLIPLDDSKTKIKLPTSSPIYNRSVFTTGLSNLDVAEYIVYYRDVDDGTGRPHGPFRSIWDLYQVTAPDSTGARYPLFYSLTKAILVARGTNGPGTGDGNISPYLNSNTLSGNGVHDDFQEQFVMLNRVSNLITTRSDSFTVYLLVQGWRNAGTLNPELVSQQRIGFVVDRSAVTRTQHDPKITVFPLK
jgi:hypothetical protein